MTIQIRKPPSLTRSSRVGIIAPGSAALSPESEKEGIRALEERGLTVLNVSRPSPSRGYLSASDTDRAAALNTLITNPDIDAIFCLRGGYGSMRILDLIDYDSARLSPKLLIGYSDITALHCALYTHAGWTAIQGPMAAVDWPDIDHATEAAFWHLAAGAIVDPILGPHGESLQPFRAGQASGRLIGGNLSMLVRLIGSRYFPPVDGAILFLEEIGEAPYRVDALLTQLKLSGVLDRISGLIIGEFTGCTPPVDRPSLSLDDVFKDHLGNASFPVAMGLKYGHVPVKTSMPFGVSASLVVTGASASLRMRESATHPDFITS